MPVLFLHLNKFDTFPESLGLNLVVSGLEQVFQGFSAHLHYTLGLHAVGLPYPNNHGVHYTNH
jgi:hypothetical protein